MTANLVSGYTAYTTADQMSIAVVASDTVLKTTVVQPTTTVLISSVPVSIVF